MSGDRATPVDQHLNTLGRTSEVEIVATSLDALLSRTKGSARPASPLPLFAMTSEYLRERRLAERDPDTGLKGPRVLPRAIRDAFRDAAPGRIPMLVRITLGFERRGQPAKRCVELLKAFAMALEDNVAKRDLVLRLGPCELAVLMRDIDPRHAPSIGERVRSVCVRAAERLEVGVTSSVTLELLNDPPSAGR